MYLEKVPRLIGRNQVVPWCPPVLGRLRLRWLARTPQEGCGWVLQGPLAVCSSWIMAGNPQVASQYPPRLPDTRLGCEVRLIRHAITGSARTKSVREAWARFVVVVGVWQDTRWRQWQRWEAVLHMRTESRRPREGFLNTAKQKSALNYKI